MSNSFPVILSDTKNDNYAQNRIIDLVFLCNKTMGDPDLEIEMLKQFSRRVKISLRVILGDSSDNEIKSHLSLLKGVAKAIGAKPLMQNIIKNEDYFRLNGYFEQHMLTNLGLLVEEARRFIAKII